MQTDDRRRGIELEGTMEMIIRGLQFFLPEEDQAQTIPGVVLVRCNSDAFAEGVECLGEIVVGDVFVTTEGIGISEIGSQLDGPVEEFDGRLMLLLQAKAVPDGTPGLR